MGWVGAAWRSQESGVRPHASQVYLGWWVDVRSRSYTVIQAKIRLLGTKNQFWNEPFESYGCILHEKKIKQNKKTKRKQNMGKSSLVFSNHGHVSITPRHVLCCKISLCWQVFAFVTFTINILCCMYLRIIIFRESHLTRHHHHYFYWWYKFCHWFSFFRIKFEKKNSYFFPSFLDSGITF